MGKTQSTRCLWKPKRTLGNSPKPFRFVFEIEQNLFLLMKDHHHLITSHHVLPASTHKVLLQLFILYCPFLPLPEYKDQMVTKATNISTRNYPDEKKKKKMREYEANQDKCTLPGPSCTLGSDLLLLQRMREKLWLLHSCCSLCFFFLCLKISVTASESLLRTAWSDAFTALVSICQFSLTLVVWDVRFLSGDGTIFPCGEAKCRCRCLRFTF